MKKIDIQPTLIGNKITLRSLNRKTFLRCTMRHQTQSFGNYTLIQVVGDPGYAYLRREWFEAKAVIESKKKNCTHFKVLSIKSNPKYLTGKDTSAAVVKCKNSKNKNILGMHPIDQKEFEHRKIINNIK